MALSQAQEIQHLSFQLLASHTLGYRTYFPDKYVLPSTYYVTFGIHCALLPILESINACKLITLMNDDQHGEGTVSEVFDYD